MLLFWMTKIDYYNLTTCQCLKNLQFTISCIFMTSSISVMSPFASVRASRSVSTRKVTESGQKVHENENRNVGKYCHNDNVQRHSLMWR